ncbi:uncharacterized protein SCHCODRAFT_02639011 [Schizophyllum commune H4-8]|nr:uncharacterized protein SCHCODRAFT_02639011 [Schizophyllum commune H4-8]KAI5887826.1 hypothetical protein SCHCODRAFT_02639011 [Schizophyllum commune H4-8]
MRCPTYDPQAECATGTPAPRLCDMPVPPRARRILGFLLKPRVAAPFCDEYCPLPDNATGVDVQAHLSYMKSYIPFLMAEKHGLANSTSVLVYRDGARLAMAFALVLADTRAPYPAQRRPPSREVIDAVATDLGLEGDDREPRWYKPAS